MIHSFKLWMSNNHHRATRIKISLWHLYVRKTYSRFRKHVFTTIFHCNLISIYLNVNHLVKSAGKSTKCGMIICDEHKRLNPGPRPWLVSLVEGVTFLPFLTPTLILSGFTVDSSKCHQQEIRTKWWLVTFRLGCGRRHCGQFHGFLVHWKDSSSFYQGRETEFVVLFLILLGIF